jgi:tRNA threonylcarbamoyladenosine biosynthesis protein TsaE
MERISESVQQTEQIAAAFARSLPAGTCVALHGEMGAGKTQFVRGLVAGLGGDPRRVSSPTFVLLNVYPTPTRTIYHLDAYRVGGSDDFEAIGFAELLEQPGIVVVEWPSRVADLLPPTTRAVWIEPIDETTRRLTLPD